MELTEKMLTGNRRALSRLFSLLEQDPSAIPSVMSSIHHRTGNANLIGITGPPGAGKSTIINRLTAELRSADSTVGVVAVDPTSSFTGGALLGDRIRMGEHHKDPGVFVRSLSTKGSQGGLSRVARASVRLLDSFGFNYVFVESVGVGQTELDVVNASETVVVVLVPEAGDSIQMMKAGLLEIGDVYVVNKSDRDGADQLMTSVQSEIKDRRSESEWSPPVMTMCADRGDGVRELITAINSHNAYLIESDELHIRRKARQRTELIDAFGASLTDAIRNLNLEALIGDLIESVEAGEMDPYTAAYQAINSREVSLRLSEAMSEAVRDS